MKARVIEISGYAGAFMSLYMTGKNVDDDRLSDILGTIEACTTRFGFIDPSNQDCVNTSEEEYSRFNSYLDKVIKYGIQHEHETLLDFIKVTIFMEDLHRGAQDDYDAHAKRMDIIRSSTRANKKSSGSGAELSDWYKDKVLSFQDLSEGLGHDIVLPDTYKYMGFTWVKTPWGYVREDYINNPDVLRGLVPLGLACDNVSTVSYRNLRHIYHLRRKGTHASPELQEAMEQMREDLARKNHTLAYYLGKVWVPGVNQYVERPNTVNALKEED